jgi:hypothetical protein
MAHTTTTHGSLAKSPPILRATLFLSLLTILAGVCGDARGATIVYLDRTTWQSAAGGPGIVDALDSGTQVAGVIDREGYTISGTAQNAFPNANGTTTIDGTGYVRVLLSGTEGSYTTFTFDAPIYSFGFDLNPHSSSLGATVSVTIDSVAGATSYDLPVTDTNGFRGFVSDVPFTTFDLHSTSTAWHGIDNVEITVPEPTSAALLGLGMFVVATMRKRRD